MTHPIEVVKKVFQAVVEIMRDSLVGQALVLPNSTIVGGGVGEWLHE